MNAHNRQFHSVQWPSLVDGQKIASQKRLSDKPGQFWDAVYPISSELTKGVQTIAVKLQAQPGNFSGGLFGGRILRNSN